MKNEIEIGKLYRHFKGGIYKILNIAINTETLEKMVVYQDAEKPDKVWVRPYDMFSGLVDKNKYPDVSQQFRFEIFDDK